MKARFMTRMHSACDKETTSMSSDTESWLSSSSLNKNSEAARRKLLSEDVGRDDCDEGERESGGRFAEGRGEAKEGNALTTEEAANEDEANDESVVTGLTG